MKSKKKIIIVFIIILLILFVPLPPQTILDGGTKTYTALTYSITVHNANSSHIYNAEKNQMERYKIKGVTVYILGKEIYSSKEKYLVEIETADGEVIEVEN